MSILPIGTGKDAKKEVNQSSPVFVEAHQDCLKDCFKVLSSNLVTMTDDEAKTKFKACCEGCRRALQIANESG